MVQVWMAATSSSSSLLLLSILLNTHSHFCSLPANYPAVPPVFEIETNQSGSFNYHDADDLFDLLMKESLNQLGEIMIFNLINTAQEHMPGKQEDPG